MIIEWNGLIEGATGGFSVNNLARTIVKTRRSIVRPLLPRVCMVGHKQPTPRTKKLKGQRSAQHEHSYPNLSVIIIPPGPSSLISNPASKSTSEMHSNPGLHRFLEHCIDT